MGEWKKHPVSVVPRCSPFFCGSTQRQNTYGRFCVFPGSFSMTWVLGFSHGDFAPTIFLVPQEKLHNLQDEKNICWGWNPTQLYGDYFINHYGDLGGGNSKICEMFTPIPWGRWIQFDGYTYFSKGLKPQPPTRDSMNRNHQDLVGHGTRCFFFPSQPEGIRGLSVVIPSVIYESYLYLEPKWPLFWLEKALFWGVDLQK